ncbi:ribose-phosphate pyrophosphokinase [Suicoccus acidiformans]|uniref:Putative ribose-phosphate pyrophosphokinase n=1 Tax=Suicoccus acidiformans TaxID=2036206 RepID=A0A347WIV0_9LACT|nr:ribose-phosphate pyrophosphokinase [Suicoccus acidiformans]AXY25007.1 ribose-phosphate pyrophosphokinase [Suicoccus acidiformans]
MIAKNYKHSNLRVFSLSSNQSLAAAIAEHLGVELGKLDATQFADGEIKINIEESIRGDHIYVIQSTSFPISDNIMELMIMIDALKRASAKKINVVLPYYGYARQEQQDGPRTPITAKLVANMLELAGADRIVTLDLHANQIQGFFDMPVDHLQGVPLIADYLIDRQLAGDDVVVVSPDQGGVTRARKLAEFLQAPIAIVDRRYSHASVVGDVLDKTTIIIDDIIDSGLTALTAADALVEYGAKSVYAAATHAVLSGNAAQMIEASPIECLLVTDTIHLPEAKRISKLEQVSVAPLLAEAIRRIHENQSVSPLFTERMAFDDEVE